MKQKALDLGVVQASQLASLGPGAKSMSVQAVASATLIRIAVTSDSALRDVAEDLGLDQARTVRQGKVWFRQAGAREGGLFIVAAGPVHQGEEPS